MGLGVGIFLIAVGAILAFAVNATSGAVDVHAVGWILMGVGLASVLIALLLVFGWWLLRRLAAAEHSQQPALEPARRERLVDLAVSLRVSGPVPFVVRGFGPDHCAHAATLSRRHRD